MKAGAIVVSIVVGVALLSGMAWASVASAASFYSEEKHTTITGAQTSTLEFAFDSTGPGTLHCKKSTFTSTVEGRTFGGFTATPSQSECTLTRSGSSIAVSTNFNGCDYRFTAAGSLEIQCPPEKSIEISGTGCTVKISPQGVNKLEYANTGSGTSRDIDITFNLSGLNYSYSGGTCGTGSGKTNGTVKGAMTAVGECADGKPIGIWSGGEADPTEPCNPPATFYSEEGHTKITGSQTTTLEFGFDSSGPGTLHCKKSTFTGTVEGRTFGGFTATPAQSECMLTRAGGNISATTNFNGCDYRLNAAAAFEITCPSESQIEISGAGCSVKVPPQSVNKLEYANTGSGTSRDIDITFNLSGLDYSYSGATCGTGSGKTNGTVKGAMTAVGECADGKSIGIWFGGEGDAKEPCELPTSFYSEVEDTVITGIQISTLVFTTDLGSTTCKKSTFSGTAVGTSFTSITATPVWSECALESGFGPFGATFNFNGCDFVLSSSGSFEIKCPVGKSISMAISGCTITIPAVSLAKGLSYTNTGSGSSRDLDISFNLSGINYSYAGFLCGTGSGTTNGTLAGVVTAVGETTGNSPVGIWRQ